MGQMKKFKALYESTMWKFIYKKNKGIFYRGVGKGGQGTGVGHLGAGIYLTWSEGMASAFAKRQGASGKVKKYKLKSNVKIVDAGGMTDGDKDWVDAKAEMGFSPKQHAGNDKMFANMLSSILKSKGFDGAVSDDVATGIVIFDKKNIKEIK
jgi:hypothetical protein